MNKIKYIKTPSYIGYCSELDFFLPMHIIFPLSFGLEFRARKFMKAEKKENDVA